MLSKYQEKAVRHLIGYQKQALFAVRSPRNNTIPVFIMGCGRSGTTMMVNVFTCDTRIESLGENDRRIARHYMLLDENIGQVIRNSKAEVLVMKPILNSFDALKILNTYQQAKIIWLVREHKDMIASSIKMFGSLVASYLKELVLHGTGCNWLAAGMPKETLLALAALDASDFTDHDWMALVWWSVNRTILLDRLCDSERFYLVCYERLVHEPEPVLSSIYSYIGLSYRRFASRFVHASSVGRGKDVRLHPSTEKLCTELKSDLRSRFRE